MGNTNLSLLFVDDLCEWFCKKEVRDYINWHRDFSYTFPDLYINDQTRSYGSTLYTFNAVDFPKEKNRGKILYHFCNLCDIILKELRDALSGPLIIFFRYEKLDDDITIAIKFCNDIHPPESVNYCCIMKEAFKELLEDDFIQQIFPMFFWPENERGKICMGNS